MNLKESSLEWAIKHLLKYYNSDFYPKLFEYKALKHNWADVKQGLLKIDLDKYIPKSPITSLAFKHNGTFRIVHLLDPIDSIVITAMTYEICEKIEKYRIPIEKNIACSYRIIPNLDGSFFLQDGNDWEKFKQRTEELCSKYIDGYVLVADITDFYNQIYLHRVQNIVAEAGHGEYDDYATIIEKFFLNLNKKASKGIPIGPASSIIYAEAIMSDIDKKVLYYTKNFARYVDDFRIFFTHREDAIYCLHELTNYIHSSHRLVFSGEKTRILTVKKFSEQFIMDEEYLETKNITRKVEDKASEIFNEYLSQKTLYGSYEEEYSDNQYENIINDIYKNEKMEILSTTYKDMITNILRRQHINYGLLRHLLKRCTYYRIRKPYEILLNNFENLNPVLREFVVYLNKVSTENIVNRYIDKINSIFESSDYKKYDYINLWYSSLFRNENFKNITVQMENIKTTRDKAFFAILKKNITWVKDFKDKIDILGPWDKRAVIYSSSLLSKDERTAWLNCFYGSDDILERSIAKYLTN